MSVKEPYRTKIATFNIGDFSGRGFEKGSEEAKQIHLATMGKVDAELWALQEDIYWFGGVKDLLPYDAIYSAYPYYYREYTGEYNGKAFLSRTEVADAERVEYVGVGRFRHPWYLRGRTLLGGREVWLFCLHFDWSDKAVRAQQITQIMADAAQHEYSIIIGDFNPCNFINDGEKVDDSSTHEPEFARFTEAGYVAANTGEFGTFNTILDASGAVTPCDNIFVSPNIKIENVGTVADPWMCDHAILWADIALL